MKQKYKIIKKTSESEFDDDNLFYKSCQNCGQGQYPFKHGLCLMCGFSNWTVNFEISKAQWSEMQYNQSLAELYD